MARRALAERSGNAASALVRGRQIRHQWTTGTARVPAALAVSARSCRQRAEPCSSCSRAGSQDEILCMVRSIIKGGERTRRREDTIRQEAVTVFCDRYSELDADLKADLLQTIARNFSPSRDQTAAAIDGYTASVSHGGLGEEMTPTPGLACSNHGSDGSYDGHSDHREDAGALNPDHNHAKAYERLREELSPGYEALFRNVVAHSDDGVRFLVDLRQDLLALSRQKNGAKGGRADPRLGALDASLRSLLQTCFSVGFLDLRRITYEDSGGALLEKIARYEAVHPVQTVAELKRRLGHGRRCFAFIHPCMPGEPLVFVHVALLLDVAESMKDIADRSTGEDQGGEEKARCAVFYSITSTQKGLQGVQLGNFLIKRVVAHLRAEEPRLETFATLSPIPSFRTWLAKKASHRAALGVDRSELSGELLLTNNEARAILSDSTAVPEGAKDHLEGSAEAEDEDVRLEARALAVLLSAGSPLTEEAKDWRKSSERGYSSAVDRGRVEAVNPNVEGSGVQGVLAAREAARTALTRLAARYLVRETVRGKIPDPVGNFHVSNGARVERINWMADPSSRGMDNSFGVMVNYVYDPRHIDSNNRQYLSQGEVPASHPVHDLAWSLSRSTEERRSKPPAGFL